MPDSRLSLVDRFRESMVMNHERWHDGIGYDLDLLQSATPDERGQIEQMITTRAVNDWRDIEALAVLDSPGARALLRRTFDSGDASLKIPLLSHAADLFSEAERTAALVLALETTDVGGGLAQALLVVECEHPPQVIQALLRGVRTRDGATAGEFAAMLLFLHGKASSPYDMEQRSFFLRFQDGDRDVLFRELCERIGVNASA